MLNTEELMEEAISLPVELRARLVEKLISSLNPSLAEIENLWATEAERRVGEINAGKVEVIPGDEVFEKIRKRHAQ
jgi:putative addiction module component (TIGR02574 family)